jgi:hypothetical protein
VERKANNGKETLINGAFWMLYAAKANNVKICIGATGT